MTGEKPPYSDVLSFYEAYDEAGRLDEEYFPLERARTRELVLRHLPPPPGVVLDIGGAAGAYAYWLAEAGYTVHLLDAVAKHVRQAEEAARHHARALASIRQGDARALPFADACADAVLLLGPLYHLTEGSDRARALAEAARVLRPGGRLFAAAISRFASFVDGLRAGSLFDHPPFTAIVEQDLRDGQHRNQTGQLRYFTASFFHRPEELRAEVEAAGFGEVEVVAVEGPAFALPDFAVRFGDAKTRETLLRFLRMVEAEPALLGASPHLLACGRAGDGDRRPAPG